MKRSDNRTKKSVAVEAGIKTDSSHSGKAAPTKASHNQDEPNCFERNTAVITAEEGGVNMEPGVKRSLVASEEPNASAKTDDLPEEVEAGRVSLVNDSVVLEPELKRRKVDIFVEDPQPKWYNAEGNNITKTIDPQKLIEAFSFLPVLGRPKCRSELAEYQENKLKEYVGGGLNDDEFERLADTCSVQHLITGMELTMPTTLPNQGIWGLGFDPKEVKNTLDEVTDAHELCVVKKFRMRLEKDVGNTYSKKLKYRGVRLIPFSEDDAPTVTLGSPLQPGKDLLYRVRIYRPFPHTMKDKVGASRFRHSIFCCDLVMLGRQRLWELRDRIVCANDVDMRLDVSDRLHDAASANAKDVFPSGFLFINNTFYVDKRGGCRDLTERVRRWAANKPGLGAFPTFDMSLRLDQVKIKLGHPEVYIHQGDCEHLFTFSEIRLLNASDPLKISHYPAHTAISQNQSMYCTTCAEFSAKWIVTECSRVPFDPAFFCDSCFRLYLYKDGKKIGNFKAFSYRGNELNMLKPQG